MKKHLIESKIVKIILGIILGIVAISNGNVFAFSVVVTTNPAGQTQICQNNVLTLKATVSGHTPPIKTITWSGAPNLTGVGLNAFFAPDNTTAPGFYTITCTVKDFLNVISSGNIIIEVLQTPTASISALGPTTFCQGSSVDLSAVTGVGYSYQWRKDYTDIPGATSSTYTATQSGDYDLVVTNPNGCVDYSSTITVTVNALPAATAGSNSPVCYNGTINLNSGPGGMVTYSWASTSVTPFTSSSQNPSITNATPNNSGDYTVTVTDGNSCVNTATTNVLVYADLNGGTIGLDQSICYNGDPAAFTDIASPSGGDGSWTYFWESKVGAGAWTPIGGATSLTYDAPAGLTQTTQYHRVATNGCGTISSNTITVTVYNIMAGGTIGSDQALCFGADPAAFTDDVSPSGGNPPWSYSWESKVGAGAWTPIAGANAITYDVPGGITQTTSYQRVATNSCGTVYSNTVTITITPALLNNTIAAAQIICSGSTPALLTGSLPTGGSGAYTYQWQSSTAGVGGPYSDIVGATSQNYQPGALVQSTWYQRVASSGSCTSTSTPIAITVNPVIANNTIAADQTICPSTTPAGLTGTLPTGGDGTYAYQWKVSTVGIGGPYNNIAGATAQNYSPTALPSARWYERVVTSGSCTSTSNIVTISLYPDILNNTIAAPQTICSGSTPALLTGSLPTGGTGPFTYQWQVSTVAVGGPFGNIGGATGQDYQPGALVANRWYRRFAFSGTCNRVSNIIAITVTPAIANNSISSPQTICSGSTPGLLTGTLPTGGTGTYTYQWQSSTAGVGGPYSDIGGATNQDYQPGALVVNTWYKRVVNSGLCTNTSSALAITITSVIANNTIAAPQTICSGSTPAQLTGTLPTGGNGTYTYQWQSSTAGVGGPFSDVSGATSQNYQPGALTQNTWYQRIVNSGPCSSISGTVAITVTPAIANNTIAAPQTICSGNTPALLTGSAPTGGTGVYTYQWQSSTAGVGGPYSDIVGATNQDYQPGALFANTWYQRVVTSGACTSTSTPLMITVNSVIGNNTIAAPQTICFGATPAQLTGTLPTGGSGSYTYQWQSSTAGAGGPFSDISGATSQNYQPGALTVNTWYQRVVTSGPCSLPSNVIAITITPSIANNTISAPQTICSGTTPALLTGSLPTGGTGVYTYQWQSATAGVGGPYSNVVGATSQDYQPGILVQNTWYQRIVTSGTCTSTSSTLAITVNPPISNNTISAAQSICYNSTPALLTGTSPAGGSGTYTYKWQQSTAGVGGPFTDIVGATNSDYQPGVLTVNTWYQRVVSSGTCIDNTSNIIAITVGPVFTVSFTSTPPKCVGSANGTATANPAGGTPGYTYSWNTVPVQTTKTATGLIAGTYTVTVTDNIGCIITGNTTISDPTPITLNPPVITNVTGCFGDSNGAIQIQANGGSSPYTYSLYNNNVFVTSKTLATGIPAIFSGLAASTLYEVRVMDANNCGPVSSGNIIITQPTQVDFTYTKKDIVCNGTLTGEIHFVASGGTPPYEYSIDDGFSWGSSADLTTLGAGNYTLKVRDANFCESASQDVEIIEPEEIITNGGTWKNITSCFNDNTGEINVVVLGGGVPPYQYSIDAGLTWQSDGLFQNLYAGNYTIIVKDASGCTVNVGPIPITQPTQITFTQTVTNVTTCWNNTNGSIRVNSAAGGKGTKMTSIDNVMYFTIPHLFSSLGIGNYTVYVKDINGCIVTKSIAITGPTPITLDAPPTIVPVSCNGLHDGEIHVSASGGAGGLTYSIDGGAYQGTGDFLALAGGDHTLNIKDLNNCIFTQTINIPEPAAIVFTAPQSTDITCFGLVDGTISAGATGGTGALTYTLLPGGVVTSPDGNFTGLSAGTYQVSVTDSKGCNQVSSNLVIIEPAVFTLDPVTDIALNCNGETTTISFVTHGGTAPITYNLTDGGAYNQTNNTGSFPNVPAGSYTYTITDAHSCATFTNVINVTEPAPIVISTPVITQMTAPGANDAKIKLNATGGTGLLTFTLTPGGAVLTAAAGVDVEFTGLSAGTYTIDVTDANGCSATTPPQLIGLLDLVLTPTQITCNGDNNGQIVLTINSGTAPYTITWTGPSGPLPAFNDMTTITGLVPGLYTVQVVDGIGVTGTNSVTITEPALLVASWVSTLDKLCFSDPNGSVTFNITGGTPPYTISWTEGGTPKTATGTVATNVAPGTYDFTITDASTCPAIVINSITLADPAKLNISKIDFTNSCFGASNGSITVTATGGTGTLNYTITGPLSTPDGIFNNLTAGTYTVALTDANGCIASSDVPLNVTLIELPQIILSAVASPYLTCPYDLGSINVTVSGGTPGYSFNWNTIPDVTTQNLTDASQGTYTVIVKDAAGCLESASATIDGPAMLSVTADISNALCNESKEGSPDFGGIEILSSTGGTGTNLTYVWNYKKFGVPVTGPILSGVSEGKYKVTITDEAGCTYDSSFYVLSDPDYYMHAEMYKPGNICYGTSITLRAKPHGPSFRSYTYKWYEIPETAGTPLGTDSIFVARPLYGTNYLVEIRNDGGCISEAIDSIGVYPKIGLNIPPYISAVKDSIISILSGTNYNMDLNVESTEFPTFFSWEPAILFSPADSWNSSIYFDEEINKQIPPDRWVDITDPVTKRTSKYIKINARSITSVGCKDSLTLYAKLVDKLSFGNVFSPNGDGVNDVWQVPRDYLFPDLEIEIFNRWGSLVWSAKGDNAAKGWNGKTDKGNELPIGTYYYVIKFNVHTNDGKWKPITGSVTIVR